MLLCCWYLIIVMSLLLLYCHCYVVVYEIKKRSIIFYFLAVLKIFCLFFSGFRSYLSKPNNMKSEKPFWRLKLGNLLGASLNHWNFLEIWVCSSLFKFNSAEKKLSLKAYSWRLLDLQQEKKNAYDSLKETFKFKDFNSFSAVKRLSGLKPTKLGIFWFFFLKPIIASQNREEVSIPIK